MVKQTTNQIGNLKAEQRLLEMQLEVLEEAWVTQEIEV